MSFSLPPMNAKPEQAQNMLFSARNFGVPDLMATGLSSSELIDAPHPIAVSEKNYCKNRHLMDMTVLRNIQGLHAPLRINMELHAAKQVSRLPFLPSSNAMFDSLTGRDLEIGPEDIYNTAEFKEVAGQTHAVMEKSLNIL